MLILILRAQKTATKEKVSRGKRCPICFSPIGHGVFETGATAPKKSEKDIETNRMCALANTAWANFAK